MTKPTCAVDGCESLRRKRGWCDKHYQRWRRTGDPATTPKVEWRSTPGPCVVCGSSDMKPGSRRYCSGRCQQLFYRARRAGLSSVPRSYRCALCGVTVDLMERGVSRASGASQRKRRSDSLLCAECRRQKHWRHKFSAPALIARDGPICGVCGEEVDADLPGSDLMGPSVDHIISRAEGGSDDPSNLQLAHLGCNIRKNKRSSWTVP